MNQDKYAQIDRQLYMRFHATAMWLTMKGSGRTELNRKMYEAGTRYLNAI